MLATSNVVTLDKVEDYTDFKIIIKHNFVKKITKLENNTYTIIVH